ncbi:MAG: SpoIIE family protein phosphatase [Cytophagales bacterium]|nr:SpoIIE family protein phosphatase [Cytophagales bacterium]
MLRIPLILLTFLTYTALAQPPAPPLSGLIQAIYSQQSSSIKFTHYTLKDGLSQSTANCITQDSKGFIWIGTQDGLNRFDGYTFTHFKHNPNDPTSISHNHVWAILEDSQGTLWIGTRDGLNCYDPKTQKFTHLVHDPNDSGSISHNDILTIWEDPQGVLWIGTKDGLNRLDPNQIPDNKGGRVVFTHYKHDPNDPVSISHNNIQVVCEDSHGVLWIGTNGGGLNCFNRATQKFIRFKHDSNDPTSISHNDIRAIREDSQGALWIGTNGGGLNRFNSKTKKFAHFKHNPNEPFSISNNYIRAIREDSKRVLWIGTNGGGLNRFDHKTQKFTHFKHNPNEPSSISHNIIVAIFEDFQGALWIGTHGGELNRLDLNTAKFTHLVHDPNNPASISSNHIWAILEDSHGALWIGTNDAGLNHFDPETRKFTHLVHDPSDPTTISHNDVRAICEDSQGALWIGTYGGGLNRLDPKTQKFTHFVHNAADPVSISHDQIRVIIEDSQGILWIGTNGGGLNRFDPKPGFTHFKHNPNDPASISNNYIVTILEDSEGTLWIGTNGGGLNRLVLASAPVPPSYSGKSSGGDNKGSTYNKRTAIEKEYSSHLPGIKFIHFMHDPNDPTSISHNDIRAIREDLSGTLWIGTRGGLNCFAPSRSDPFGKTQKFTSWRATDIPDKPGANVLPNDLVYGVLIDDKGNVWGSTNNGIFKFTPPDQGEKRLGGKESRQLAGTSSMRPAFRNYDVSDGLQSNEFNQGAYHKGKSGLMYFGGINGFNAFYPDSVKDNPIPPPIVITNFQIFNQPVLVIRHSQRRPNWASLRMSNDNAVIKINDRYYMPKHISYTDTIILSHKENVLYFEFAVLHYSNPAKNQYAYKMAGFENSWNYVGTKRYATYTNLDHGEYIFKVKGSNNDGVWTERSVNITIIITPRWWQTITFKILAIIFIILGVFSYIKYRERTLKKQQRVLEHKVEERTSEVVKQKKHITDSVEYAQQIQKAILPPEEYITKSLPDHFILFKPKDIVSGDFYWINSLNSPPASRNAGPMSTGHRPPQRGAVDLGGASTLITAIADCTGHGVPGAFMSILGVALLNEIIVSKKIVKPNEILDELRALIIESLHQTGKEGEAQEGMDIALCVINTTIRNGIPSAKSLQFAGAFNSLYLIRDGQLIETKADRMSVGVHFKQNDPFTNHHIKILPGDIIYTFSDGYADQLGGSENQKLMFHRFKKLLLSIHKKPLKQQKQILNTTINEWKAYTDPITGQNYEQTDDILVMGMRF